MKPLSFRRHRFPPEIIRHAIWLYARFTLSFRDVEELLAERGIALAAMREGLHAEDEARRIAANIAKLPGLLPKK